MRVDIYTKEWCAHCIQAKVLLKKKGIAFEEIDGMKNFPDMVHRAHRHGNVSKTFPQIFFVFDDGEEHIGGYDQLVLYFEGK